MKMPGLSSGNGFVTLAIGAGIAVAVPLFVGILEGIMRPAGRAGIKGGGDYDQLKESGSEVVDILPHLAVGAGAEAAGKKDPEDSDSLLAFDEDENTSDSDDDDQPDSTGPIRWN
jgi:hypothetical protein